MSKRLMVAAVLGVVAGVVAVVGNVLPWLSISITGGSSSGMMGGMPDQTQSVNGLMASNTMVLPLAVVLLIAGGWFWAGSEPKKPAVIAAATGFTIAAIAVWIVTSKEDAMGFGSFGQSTTIEYGVYVTLVGAVLGVVAGVVAALPERSAAVSGVEETPAPPVDAE
jgi:hypothetical protein